MYNRNPIGKQSPGICIARSSNLLDPKSWRGWNGSHFSIQFIDPYRTVKYRPEDHLCETINILGLSKTDCNIFGIVWSVDWKKFVATVGCIGGEQRRAFYFATSNDLIHWGDDEAKVLYNQSIDLPPDISSQTTSFNYPAFLDPTAYSNYNDPNFYTIGKRPYLLWTGLGHSPYTDGRHLWATPMELEDMPPEMKKPNPKHSN
jgi:hypothetical protein